MGLNTIYFNNINLDDDNLMMMTLKLLLMQDPWLSVIDANNLRQINK